MQTTSEQLSQDAASVRERSAHPVTWWVFGLSAAFLATTTSSGIQLLVHSLICVSLVAIFQRSIRALGQLRIFLILALAVILIRVIFRIIFGGDSSIWADVLAGANDGLRLAAIILSVAVANAMANPRRLLKHMPGALYEIAAAISVALNLVPELISSLQRVRKSSMIRGRSKGLRALKSIVIPVLEDSLERSMQLAASMSARGFGRRGRLSRRQVLTNRLASLLSLLGVVLGTFFLLMGSSIELVVIFLSSSFAAAFVSIRTASKANLRTRFVASKFELVDFVLLTISGGLILFGVLQ